MDIIYQHLTPQQIGPELFSGFDRWQNVTRCWRKENGSWVLRDIAFIDDWNEEEYIFLYDCLKNTFSCPACTFPMGCAVAASAPTCLP